VGGGGAAAVLAAGARQRPWARDMTVGLNIERITGALDVLTRMDRHLAKESAATDANSKQESDHYNA
jgi:hypothetical protein